MGDHRVAEFASPDQKRAFTRHLLNDLKAMEQMLKDEAFEHGSLHIGAEQELGLVGNDWRPTTTALEIIEAVNDEHFTNEIALFNAEINLDPQAFKGECFSKMERQLIRLLKKGKKAAAKFDTKLILTGIMPTIYKEHLQFDCMTPNPRYKALNDRIRSERGEDFEVNIVGIDELMTKHSNILFEACNTSFQVHLQVNADEFVQQYNWAQAIAGPVMSLATNSPLLMGKRLWSETRIALFQQSVDVRSSSKSLRDREPRVTFGKEWLRDSPAELFKDNISRYSMLFASDIEEDSLSILKSGRIPELNALKMHNGTVYKWNRICYGIGKGKPHLRIENRYIPAGPTVVDEMANAAFWLGLMKGCPEEWENIQDLMSFEDARYNFYNAARTGLDSQFRWMGETVSAGRLIEEKLLPMAKAGLSKMNVHEDEIDRLMNIIESRVYRHITGASWTQKNFGELLIGSTSNEASLSITKKIYENEVEGNPVHTWPNLDPTKRREVKEYTHVSQIMTTDIFTVQEDDLLDLVINMMDWRDIPYVPVENADQELVGMVSFRLLIKYFTGQKEGDESAPVSEIMVTDSPVCDPKTTTAEAVRLMAENRVGCLPVTSENKLVGIITESDIMQVAKITGKFE